MKKFVKGSLITALIMFILGIVLFSGGVVSRITGIDMFLNSLLFGCVLIYGFNTLVFWATSKVRFIVAAGVGLIQPTLILAMFILISFFAFSSVCAITSGIPSGFSFD